MTQSYQTIEVRPCAGALGAEIGGVDLANGCGEAQFGELRRAFGEFGVIFFRDQSMTPDQHVAFAERWGGIVVNRFFRASPENPLVAEVRKEPGDTANIGNGWHTDHSYDEVPAMGSMLIAREVPEAGGDTMFASMYAAWEALSAGMKSMLAGLRAVHSSRHVFGPEARGATTEYAGRVGNPEAATQDAIHPVALRHPETGRTALYVNPTFTLRFEDWSAEESKPVLDYLYAHAARPEFTTRFRWREGSIAFWDNRATWHRAINDYHGHRRLMHRITLEGVPLG